MAPPTALDAALATVAGTALDRARGVPVTARGTARAVASGMGFDQVYPGRPSAGRGRGGTSVVTMPGGCASGPARSAAGEQHHPPVDRRGPEPARPPMRAPGRPRDTRRDEAIISATLHTLADYGFAGLSMEAVAARAGVGKATVYRRWPTKDALVVEALGTLADLSGGAQTGSLRDDLVAWLNTVRKHSIQTLAGRILPRLLAEKEEHPDLFEAYRRRVMAPVRDRVAALLRDGIVSGELSPDIDIDMIIDMLVGSVAYWQYTGHLRDVSGSRITGVVDTVLRGILQRSGPDTAELPAGQPTAGIPAVG
ncbi:MULTISPECIES: TetR/AcrR family transcriptional regulator [unclassified Frankia]|uniref:TetR/AcrR family transcriptional regulator n=1 Tax=unclassified Frankia TaxID=2632575 RepID=UPI00202527DD